MVKGREPQQVAKRAVILSAMAFRSSLEVTSHPRVAEFAQRLLPWLAEVECADELDPFEREELATPLGQLSESQMIDVRWAGEGAAFLCWTLRLAGELHETTPADAQSLPTFNSVLKPDAAGIIASASLRDRVEIEKTCRHFALILSMLRESRVGPPATDVIRRMHLREMNRVGLSVTEDDIARASEALSKMTPDDRTRVASLYNIRRHVAIWYLSDRPSYFEPVKL